MKRISSRRYRYSAVHAKLLHVGLEVFPIYGDDDHGWSMDATDFDAGMPSGLRYRSLDELYFALVNLNIGPEGRA